jgi:hypothetical protein
MKGHITLFYLLLHFYGRIRNSIKYVDLNPRLYTMVKMTNILRTFLQNLNLRKLLGYGK